MKTLSNRITFDRLCRLLGVETWEEILDRVPEFWTWDSNLSDEDNQRCEEREAEDAFRKHHDAVMHVSEQVFGHHGLDLNPMRIRRKLVPERAAEFRIVPVQSWKHSAEHIRETINGMGPFRFDSLKEFLDSGPYTARQAVLSHLGWIPGWYEVYEGGKASARVEKRLR